MLPPQNRGKAPNLKLAPRHSGVGEIGRVAEEDGSRTREGLQDSPIWL
jgi:hypothetical protein